MAKLENGDVDPNTTDADTDDVDDTETIDKATVQGWVREVLAEVIPTMSSNDDDDVDDAPEPTRGLTIKDVEEATRRAVAEAMKPLRATAKKAAPKKAAAPVKEPEDVPVEPGRKTWTERLWGASE